MSRVVKRLTALGVAIPLLGLYLKEITRRKKDIC